METQIKRIERMERHLDEASSAVREMTAALNHYAAALDGIRALADYSDGGAWRADYEADEAGKLPEDLKRGVLSQDALYDLLTDDRAMLGRMAELLEYCWKEGLTWN
ncbi:MAG: DUF4298 domain-containing protein [Oscillospiraceae bacterium]|nr:DUF4298 domain-containing protein [Oscillospiraceae bacterium]